MAGAAAAGAGHHHGGLAPFSQAAASAVARRPASGVRVPRPQGHPPGRAARRGEAAPRVGGATPETAARAAPPRAAGPGARREQRGADLVEPRHRFVRHEPTPAQRRRLRRRTRGLPPLRTWRALVDEVDRRLDRRCQTATALRRLTKRRRRVRRRKRRGRTLDQLRSANLGKALGFLDDRLLPSTSHAGGRGNRRFRKAQKSISGVRTPPPLGQRSARDRQRERRANHQRRRLKALPQERSDS